MRDEELKKILLSEPSPKANQQFQMRILHQLNGLSTRNEHYLKTSNQIAIPEKSSYWQYIVMVLMTAVTILVLTHHQQTDHLDDELAKLNPITELTLSTL